MLGMEENVTEKGEGFQCTGEYTETLPVLIDIEYPLLVILFIS